MGVLKVLKADRLHSLQRLKDNGEVVFRGAEDPGACIVKLVEAQFGPSEQKVNLILAHCNQLLVLCAQVKNWPISVKKSGTEIGIWLHDYAFIRSKENPFLFREFKLDFFTDFAAADFFKAYTSILTEEGVKPGLLYQELHALSFEIESIKKRKWGDVVDDDCDAGGLGDVNEASDDDKSSDEDQSSDDEESGDDGNEGNEGNTLGFDQFCASQDVYSETRIVTLPLKRPRFTLSDEL